MKKIFFMLCLSLATFNAFAGQLKPGGDELPLIYVDPITDPFDDHGRGPIEIPNVTHDGYTLYFWDDVEFTVNIKEEDGNGGEQVVFTTVVPASQTAVNLPTTLSGTYTIEVIRGNQTFAGVLEL